MEVATDNIVGGQSLNSQKTIQNTTSSGLNFYFILKGTVRLESIVEVQQITRWPLEYQKWHILRTKKIIKYVVGTLTDDEFVGHRELIKFNMLQNERNQVLGKNNLDSDNVQFPYSAVTILWLYTDMWRRLRNTNSTSSHIQ